MKVSRGSAPDTPNGRLADTIGEILEAEPTEGLRAIVLVYNTETNAASLVLANYISHAEALKDALRIPAAIEGGDE